MSPDGPASAPEPEVAAGPSAGRRRRPRPGPLLRLLLPPLFTLVLAVLLVFTMFFTEFDWRWVTFLAGILFAAVLSLISASWKSSWRMARRTAEVMRLKQRLSAEIEQHRDTREQLERERALHRQDRVRFGREIKALRLDAAERQAAGQAGGALAPAEQAPEAAEAAEPPEEESRHAATQLAIADESGNAIYLSSLTEELSGWDNPRERIRDAIENNGFELYVQDIVALQAGASPALMRELLIRMRDEEQNLVPPGTFLPIAERAGMMPDIDRFVVREAIAAQTAAGAGAHPAAGAASLPLVCINLARSTVEDRSFPAFVARALEKDGLSGANLCFEIADGDAHACLSRVLHLARELKPLGCRFSLGGFGRMGVGFDHVKTLSLDFLKIDGSIVLQIQRVPEALTKIRAIQRVCKAIGIRTVAEMVESDESLEKLRSVDVDYAQGFGIDRPRPF